LGVIAGTTVGYAIIWLLTSKSVATPTPD